ncbi:hypothetical protein ANCCEY_04589 [Ancylostoma ceylanicum]|uniref:Tc1-like transposase DDE domain-containing protein n=2 Tax=Ancylostoma ceylanicum TaxID=53326 RepID=A0A0D6M921_9BILA|nr:hypothetical protein ANCCEY_04589 [Ancylostoma ceylanicum]EYC18948.1 hypothetical protein Y032_0026g1471 [Ancylostoma ceylanicum]
MLYYKIMTSCTTVIVKVYADQPPKVADSICQRSPECGRVYLMHDNNRPHAARMAKDKISELRCVVLSDPVYSADLAPPNYHLVLALERHLKVKNFDNQVWSRTIPLSVTRFLEEKNRKNSRQKGACH